ncbi:hypothetical protein FOZ60_017152, partial [Perkinsus olseni]
MPSVDTDKWKAIEANSNTLSMPASDRNLIMREGYIVIDSLRLRCRESLLEIHQGKLPWTSCFPQGEEEAVGCKLAATSFMEEGMVMLQGATAGLSLDEAKHAIEKIVVS